MIMSVRCPPNLKEQIDALLEAGLYPDFSAFCVAAIENQLLLEEADSPDPGREIPTTKKARSPAVIQPGERTKKGFESGERRKDIGAAGPGLFSGAPGEASEIRRLQATSSFPISADLAVSRISEEPPFSLPSTFADMFHDNQNIPLERWLFGQYNRLLPAKVSIRALAVISSEGKDALLLDAVAARIAGVAAKMGDYLRSLDRRFVNHRDDALATAFPDGGAEGQKGRVRYQNHFVGHTVKGEQGGMLVGLKLATIQVIKNKPHILPTVAGWDLARLTNALLDSPVTDSPSRLSREEVSFLLRHIKEHVPAELFAYRVMLSLISEGKSTPESVSRGLARYLGPGKKLEDEQDFLSTQRSGVLGRLADLGLVGRERQGTRITYRLTTGGEEFLSEVGIIPIAA